MTLPLGYLIPLSLSYGDNRPLFQLFHEVTVRKSVLWSFAALGLSVSLAQVVGGPTFRALGLRSQIVLATKQRDPAFRSTRQVPGRWVNGSTLKFEDETTASPSVHALDARKIALEADGATSPAIVIDQALLALLDGKPLTAARLLEQGLFRSPSEVSLLNDLAVVDLARAAQGDSYSLILGLDAVERCLNFQPNLKEALFNRALILERLSLISQAREAWDSYIDLKEDGPWTETARSHLASIERTSLEEYWRLDSFVLQKAAEAGEGGNIASLVARYPQPSRMLVQEEILIRWAKARISGDMEGASRESRIGKRIAAALLRLNGERSASDAIQEIESAETRDKGIQLAEAYLSLEKGLRAYQNLQPQKALPLLSQARKVFASTGSSSAMLWADFWLAGTNYYLGHNLAAEAKLGTLLSSPNIYQYSALRGRVFWSLGLIMLVRSEYSQAIQNYHSALSEFERLGELENIGAVQALIAENLRYLGEERQAWAARTIALAQLSSFPSSVRLHNVLADAADQLVSSGLPTVARYFHSEDFEVSRRIGKTATVAEALLGRSRDLFALGYLDLAWADIREAKNHIASITDTPTRKRFEADAGLAAGEFADAATAKSLTEEISLAVDYYDKIKSSNLAALARLVRARVLLLTNQTAEAEHDLRTAIGLHESGASSIDEPGARAAYRKQWQSVFDETIELQAVQRHDPESAFSMLEYAKDGKTTGIRYVSIQRYLQPGDALVEFALLRNRILLWVIHGEFVDFTSVELNGKRLDHLIEKLIVDLRGPDNAESFRRESAVLFETLARPVLIRAPMASRWIVVPDRSLEQIPFAALWDTNRSRFLIEDRIIVYEPAASRFIESHRLSGVAGRRQAKRLNLAVIGNPRPDRRRYPTLTDLQGAESEADEVAALYARKTILKRERATRGAFFKALTESDAVHFAGHSSFSKEDPMASVLFLAADRNSDSESAVHVRELIQIDLRHIELFILSACETSPAGGAIREGLPGFAGSLLAAGVASVVATRWQIPDQSSRTLLVNFHRRFIAGQNGDEALQGVQIDSIEAGDSPRVWAAFNIFGAVQ